MSNRLSLNCGLALFLVALKIGSPARAADLSDYGAYLWGECKSCHQSGAKTSAIPPLDALSPEFIVEALHAYQSGERTNPVMVSVARGLSEEQIVALAAFFAAGRSRRSGPGRR